MTTLLPPDGHLLLSFMSRGVPWAKVIAEFVDNAFDDAAGNSREALIELYKDAVSITDCGRGIEDINRLGRLGASASYRHEGNIGQYGVGSKTWMCKAEKLDVETIFNGRQHKHTFNLSPARRALKAGTPIPWLNAYNGKGQAVTKPTFSRLTLREFNSSAGSIITPALITELQRTYWPGLSKGREIIIRDNRRRQAETELVIHALAPPSWTDKITFESIVNGRRYKATIGMLSENIGAYSGLFIGFLFRNICVEKSLCQRAVPPRVHGQIELSGDWRDALSNYKDDIIKDRDELFADIEAQAKQILDLADEYTEDLRLEKIALEIETISAKALRKKTGRLPVTKSRLDGQSAEKESDEKSDAADPSTKQKPKGDPADSGPDSIPGSGIRICWQHLGHDTLGIVSLVGRTVTVTFNRDCAKLEAQSRQPQYPGLYLTIGNEIAMKCTELSATEIEDIFGPMIGEASGTEDKAKMMRAIRVWWGFVAEDGGNGK